MPSREEVFEAANELRAEGELVSLRNVIRRTGGSNSVVGPLLVAWKEEADYLSRIESANLGEVAQTKLVQCYRELQAHAVAIERAKFDEERERLRAKVEAERAVAAEACVRADALEAVLAFAVEQLESLLKRVDKVIGEGLDETAKARGELKPEWNVFRRVLRAAVKPGECVDAKSAYDALPDWYKSGLEMRGVQLPILTIAQKLWNDNLFKLDKDMGKYKRLEEPEKGPKPNGLRKHRRKPPTSDDRM